jgi:hypothetical protein
MEEKAYHPMVLKPIAYIFLHSISYFPLVLVSGRTGTSEKGNKWSRLKAKVNPLMQSLKDEHKYGPRKQRRRFKTQLKIKRGLKEFKDGSQRHPRGLLPS